VGKTIAMIKELQAVCKKYNGYMILEKAEDPQDEYIGVDIGIYDDKRENIEACLEYIDEDSLQTVIEREGIK
jgi:hypothetical protein